MKCKLQMAALYTYTVRQMRSISTMAVRSQLQHGAVWYGPGHFTFVICQDGTFRVEPRDLRVMVKCVLALTLMLVPVPWFVSSMPFETKVLMSLVCAAGGIGAAMALAGANAATLGSGSYIACDGQFLFLGKGRGSICWILISSK